MTAKTVELSGRIDPEVMKRVERWAQEQSGRVLPKFKKLAEIEAELEGERQRREDPDGWALDMAKAMGGGY